MCDHRLQYACRLESVSTVLANSNLDDPLENAEQLAEQMESLPFIFRFEYEDMNTYFCSIMDPLVTAYSRGVVPGTPCTSKRARPAWFISNCDFPGVPESTELLYL